jgi:preprotein translocase subunit SecY
MLEKLANIFRVPDLRKRVLFTLGLLAVYRIGGHIPTPGINGDRWPSSSSRTGAACSVSSTCSAAATCAGLTIFALGIMPYITASIILQLLTVVYEPLAKLQKEGEWAARKSRSGRAISPSFSARCNRSASPSAWRKPAISSIALRPVYPDDHADPDHRQAFIMWLGEQITERGIGNGMSLLIFAGIVVGLPRGVADLYQKASTAAWGAFTAPALIILV